MVSTKNSSLAKETIALCFFVELWMPSVYSLFWLMRSQIDGQLHSRFSLASVLYLRAVRTSINGAMFPLLNCFPNYSIVRWNQQEEKFTEIPARCEIFIYFILFYWDRREIPFNSSRTASRVVSSLIVIIYVRTMFIQRGNKNQVRTCVLGHSSRSRTYE